MSRELRLAFAIILAISLFANAIVPFVIHKNLNGRGPSNTWDSATILAGMLNGVLIGEFVAIAFWIVFEKMHVAGKLLFGALFGLGLSIAFVFGIQVWPGMPMAAAIFLLVVGIILPIGCLLFVLFGSSFFQIVAWFTFKIVRSGPTVPKFFEPFPQSIAFGLLVSSVILGLLFRFLYRNPLVDAPLKETAST